MLMTKTILFIATLSSIVGVCLYEKESPEIETVREVVDNKVETKSDFNKPILVRPNVVFVQQISYVDKSVSLKIENLNWEQEMLKGVKFFEGFRSKPYFCCAGVKTIGYGCTDKNIVSRGVISENKASDILHKNLKIIQGKVLEEVNVPLSDSQLCALTSFAYNVGISNLKKLINGPNRLNEGNYESVENIMPKYRIAGGKVRKGLEKRRAWEVSLWKGEPEIL